MSRESIRALVDAATPGPWKSRPPTEVPKPERSKYGCVYFGPSLDEWYTTSPLEKADAAFIAASRTAVPLLLAVADAAQNLLWYTEGLLAALEEEDGGSRQSLQADALRDALAELEAAP